MVNKKAKVWLEMGIEDLEVAELTFNSARYMHTAFMCQQAIEKAVKAIYVFNFNKVPPRKHDLLSLFKDAGLYSEIKRSQWKPILAKLSSLYILARYPDDLERNDIKVNKDNAKELLSTTKEVIAWLKTKMK